MTVHVRPFRDADYPRFVEIANTVVPEFRQNEAEARRRDETWDRERYHRDRVVADDETGCVVGWGEIGHMPDQFHPDRYFLDLQVEPLQWRRGIGGALYERLLRALTARGAAVVRAEAKETSAEGARFLAGRGFVEAQRAWESRLYVPAFDPARFAGAAERVANQGITFTDLATERARDPESLRAVYNLFLACSRDIPEIDPVTDVSFEHFVAREVEDPAAWPNGYLLAVDRGRYVGLSNLLATAEEPAVLYQGLTGVLSEYRGRGIAMALKLLTVAYARERRHKEIRTWNNTRNRPMLRINEAMGFVKEPVWIVFQKQLGEVGR